MPEVLERLLLAEVVQRRQVPRGHVLSHVIGVAGLCKMKKGSLYSTLYFANIYLNPVFHIKKYMYIRKDTNSRMAYISVAVT